MDWPPDHTTEGFGFPSSRRSRSINWRLIFVALITLAVILAIAIWAIGGGSDEPATVDTVETTTTTTSTTTTSTTVAISTTTFTTTIPLNAGDYGPSKLGDHSTLSTVGLDVVSFGLTVAQAQRAAGTLLVPITPVGDCYHVVPHDAPEGIVFLVQSGTIERADINSGIITTRSGVGIGTLDETIFALFGDSIETSIRNDGTVDLVFVPQDSGDANFRVVFNIADGKVRMMKAGRIPYVLADTGCETS